MLLHLAQQHVLLPEEHGAKPSDGVTPLLHRAAVQCCLMLCPLQFLAHHVFCVDLNPFDSEAAVHLWLPEALLTALKLTSTQAPAFSCLAVLLTYIPFSMHQILQSQVPSTGRFCTKVMQHQGKL